MFGKSKVLAATLQIASERITKLKEDKERLKRRIVDLKRRIVAITFAQDTLI